jgi:hypothetical protein
VRVRGGDVGADCEPIGDHGVVALPGGVEFVVDLGGFVCWVDGGSTDLPDGGGGRCRDRAAGRCGGLDG